MMALSSEDPEFQTLKDGSSSVKITTCLFDRARFQGDGVTKTEKSSTSEMW